MTDADFRVRLVQALERIAVAVEAFVAPPQDEPQTDPPTCEHPIDARISFGATDGVPDWQCGECGYRTVKG